MGNVVVRSIFNTAVVERNWKTQLTSAIIHLGVIGAAFLIVVPVAREMQNPAAQHVVLVAPYVPKVHATIEAPHVRHIVKVIPPVAPPVVNIPPPIVAKVEPAIPVQKVPVAPQPRIEADAKPVLPQPAPKPVVKVGGFEDLQAKAAPVPKQVVVGGFGDPRGAQPSELQRPQPVLMARVGSFDAPGGAGQTGGGGRMEGGTIKQSGFGNATATSNSANGLNLVKTGNFGDSGIGAAHSGTGTVRSTGFGDTIAATPQHKPPPTSVPSFTPVEILFKPRPSYSEEARGLRLEGQVSIEVVFQASGEVKVVRIIKGLGHGLDEAAQQAALQVKFKPATRGGSPVDTNATISITFQLT